MGQKVNPVGLRLGIVKTWESRWFSGKKYADYIYEDFKIRKFIKRECIYSVSRFIICALFPLKIKFSLEKAKTW